MANIRRFQFFIPVLILILAAGLKIYLLMIDVVPFNSDEAVVALMARHILGGERPLIFYGQAYMGSLDAYLVAISFLIIGQKVIAIRLVQMILYLLVIITTFYIAFSVFHSWKTGVVSALLLAIPNINTTLYTTASLGGYGEALLCGNLILITGIKIWNTLSETSKENNSRKPFIWMFVLGLFSGFGFWINAITGVYILPVVIILVIKLVKTHQKALIKFLMMSTSGVAFLLGSAAWWVYAFKHGLVISLNELVGGAIQNSSINIFQSIFDHLVNLILLGVPVIFGLRPPWEVKWLFIPFLPIALFCWIYIFLKWKNIHEETHPAAFLRLALIGILATLLVAFTVTHFGNDPSGRYFLPLSVVFSLIAAEAVILQMKNKYIQWLVPGVIVLYQFIGTIQCANNYPPGITTQFYAPSAIDHRFDRELINFLNQNDEKFGYTNYWVSYPLAFLSREELIYTPLLPYHLDLKYTSRDNRYGPYNAAIDSSEKVAYIVTKNPPLEALLKNSFIKNNISWKEKIIGDYAVYYQLSKVIKPAEIGFQ